MANTFTQEDQFVGKQILIDSDRLVFNGRDDSVFSSKNLLTKVLIPLSSSTTKICAIGLSIYYSFKNTVKINNLFRTRTK